MERNECEKIITEKLNEIWDIYRDYNPKGKVLHIELNSTLVNCYNRFWDEDSKAEVRIYRYRDGNPV